MIKLSSIGVRVAVCLVVALLFGAASAQEVIIVNEPVYLPLDDGTTVLLPPGNYSSINRVDGVWYVNGAVYPSGDIPEYLPEDDLVAYAIVGGVVVAVVCACLILFVRRENN